MSRVYQTLFQNHFSEFFGQSIGIELVAPETLSINTSDQPLVVYSNLKEFLYGVSNDIEGFTDIT